MERLMYDNFEKNLDVSTIIKTGCWKVSWNKFEQNVTRPSTETYAKFNAVIQTAEWHCLSEAFIEIEIFDGNSCITDLYPYTFNLFFFKNIEIKFNETQIEHKSSHPNLYPYIRNFLEENTNFDEIPPLCGTNNSYFANPDWLFRLSNTDKQAKYVGLRTDNNKTSYKFMLSEFSQFFKNSNFLPNSRIEISFDFYFNVITNIVGVAFFTNEQINGPNYGLSSDEYNVKIFIKSYDLKEDYHHILNSYIANNPIKFNVTDARLANVIELVPKSTLMRGNICVNTNEFDSLCLLSSIGEKTDSPIPFLFWDISKVEFAGGKSQTVNYINKSGLDFNFNNVPVYFSKFILSIDDHVVINYEKDNVNMNFYEYLNMFHRSIMKFPQQLGYNGFYNMPLIFEFSRFFSQNGFRNQVSLDKNIKFEFNYYATMEKPIDFLFITILNRQFTYLNNKFFLNKEY